MLFWALTFFLFVLSQWGIAHAQTNRLLNKDQVTIELVNQSRLLCERQLAELYVKVDELQKEIEKLKAAAKPQEGEKK
jgi:hypothetical protein